MKSYVVVYDSAEGTSYPVDTPEEVEAAESALVNAGQYSARIYFGDPADPDSYWGGQTLYQPGWAHERNDKPPTENR